MLTVISTYVSKLIFLLYTVKLIINEELACALRLLKLMLFKGNGISLEMQQMDCAGNLIINYN